MNPDGPKVALPEGWIIKELHELVDVLDSMRKPINSKERLGRIGTVPYFGASGQVGTIDKAIFNEDLVLLGEDGVQFFDVDKHKAYEISGPSWVNNHAHVLRCRKDEYFQRLLVCYLNQFDYRNYANGTTRLKLTQAAMNRIPVLVPPMIEQEKLIEILEEQLSRLDSAISSVHAVQKKAARFRRSLLNSIFENQFQKHGGVLIEEMLEVLPSGRKLDQGWSPQCLRQPVENAEDWGVLITTAVQHGRFDWNENKLLPKTMEPRKAIEVNEGDFLMTRLGPRPRCGVACMVRETRKQLMVPDKMYRFRPNPKMLNADFLNIYITSPRFLDAIELLKTGTSESGMNITQSRFLGVEVPKTPVDEQIEIAQSIDLQLSRLNASLAIADAIEKRTSALRRSLLHAAFTGDLTKGWREGAHE